MDSEQTIAVIPTTSGKFNMFITAGDGFALTGCVDFDTLKELREAITAAIDYEELEKERYNNG